MIATSYGRTAPDPATPDPAKPLDPVDRMLHVFETADDRTLEKIDGRIGEVQSQLDRLKRMRAAIAKSIGIEPPKKKPSTGSLENKPAPVMGEKLGDRIAAYIRQQPAGVRFTRQALAKHFEITPQGVEMAVRKHPQLRVVDRFVQAID